ncbi:unannotated protein [freshwater metagenome]|uniref:Unannotated protein n=1 Tax=freshwater metagenome TaxID=449393 RepID=A0A6J6QSX5_9ZZZZ
MKSVLIFSSVIVSIERISFSSIVLRICRYAGCVKASDSISVQSFSINNSGSCKRAFNTSRSKIKRASLGSGRQLFSSLEVSTNSWLGGRCFTPCETAAETISTSTPSQPAKRRVYSGRRDLSRIWAIKGAAALRALIRPSAESNLWCASSLRIANSNNGTRRAIKSRRAKSPFCWRKSHGSKPSGSTATNV